MTLWRRYRRRGVIEARPYVPGEDLTGISVSPSDTPERGGMIARDPANRDDRWYVAPHYFAEKYEGV